LKNYSHIVDNSKGGLICASWNPIDWSKCEFCGKPSKYLHYTIENKLICYQCGIHSEEGRHEVKERSR
jgi:hypothetical protein